jgi:hypothetical protein
MDRRGEELILRQALDMPRAAEGRSGLSSPLRHVEELVTIK